jgi:hypothetical protein
MGKEELIKGCYEWQVNILKFVSWTKKLSEELDGTGMGYIWQDPQQNSVIRILKK